MKQQQDVSQGAVANLGAAVRNPEDFLRSFMALIISLGSAIAWPLEMVLYPGYGTRYLHPIVQLLSWAIQVVVFIGGGMLAMARPMPGLMGLGTFYALFWIGGAYHSFRCWRLMVKPHLEIDGQDEGASWWFFRMLPYGQSWGPVRIGYEPALVGIAGALFTFIHLFNPLLGAWVLLMAFALFVKNACRYYEGWLFVRINLDNKAHVGLIERIIEGEPVPQTVGGFPVILPPDTTHADKARIIGKNLGLDAETEALLSPRTPAAVGD